MKKFFTLCIGLISSLAVGAQGDFPLQFADKDGNIIADGTVINLTSFETDDFGTVQMPTRLYVKNTTDAPVQGGAVYEIQSISNGAFQTCFPANCVRQQNCGLYEANNGNIEANELRYMQTEWFPESEGTCVVTYQLRTYRQNPNTGKWIVDGNGPEITLNFSYAPTGIEAITDSKEVKAVAYYTQQGQRVHPQRQGLHVVKTTLADGTVTIKKIVIH